MHKDRWIVWFKDVGKDDIPQVGGKGANLGEMAKASIPVPPVSSLPPKATSTS